MPKLNVFEQAIMKDYLDGDWSGRSTLLNGAESLRAYYYESGIRSNHLPDLRSTFYEEFEKSLIDLQEYLNGNLRFAPNNIQKLLGRKAPLSESPLPSDKLIARVKERTMESFDDVTGRDINRGGNYDHLNGNIINLKFSFRDCDYFVIGRMQKMSPAEKKVFLKKHDEFWKHFDMQTMPLGRGIFRAAGEEFSESIKEKTGVCVSAMKCIPAGPHEGEDILVFKGPQSPDNDDIRELVKASEYTPEPIDTTGIKPGPLAEQLSERLAENLHNDWYASRRDEAVKQAEEKGVLLEDVMPEFKMQYPDFMPWDELPEESRSAAVSQARETVKVWISESGGPNVAEEVLRAKNRHVNTPGIEELLTRNAHEVWARDKMAAGWRWAPERNNVLKHHPMLIPYDVLPESEKEYDRKVARMFRQTLENVLNNSTSLALPEGVTDHDSLTLSKHSQAFAEVMGAAMHTSWFREHYEMLEKDLTVIEKVIELAARNEITYEEAFDNYSYDVILEEGKKCFGKDFEPYLGLPEDRKEALTLECSKLIQDLREDFPQFDLDGILAFKETFSDGQKEAITRYINESYNPYDEFAVMGDMFIDTIERCQRWAMDELLPGNELVSKEEKLLNSIFGRDYLDDFLDDTKYKYIEFLEKEKPTTMQAGETKELVSESIVEKPVKKHQEENPRKMEWQTIDPEGLQGRRIFVIYPEDVSEGHPLPMCVEGRLTNDGKAYVSFSDSNRIVPEDGLIMVKNPKCNIYEAFNRKTFDLLYQMNPDGTASRKKRSETMKPGTRKKPSLKK